MWVGVRSFVGLSACGSNATTPGIVRHVSTLYQNSSNHAKILSC